jgi:hypothetical protein
MTTEDSCRYSVYATVVTNRCTCNKLFFWNTGLAISLLPRYSYRNALNTGAGRCFSYQMMIIVFPTRACVQRVLV